MTEALNECIIYAFTTEDIISLKIPVTKCEGNQSDNLGQLFVTPEMKIKKTKDNQSPGVNGIPTKLLKES